jgi:MFS family permease
MAADITTSSIAHIIQLAVAPVFLLTGIGSLLAVLAGRLGRIVDRARSLEGRIGSTPVNELMAMRTELARLAERKRWINRAITLCTLCALLVCLVIAVLFVGAVIEIRLGIAVAVLFILAMVVLVAGLLCFLREIYVAVHKERTPREH